jgi:rubredoxin
MTVWWLNKMGRKPEFKVSKAFTIGMQEAGFLAEESHRMGMKASQYINWLLREAMLEKMQREPTKPQASCNKCLTTTSFDFIDERWICDDCGNDRTDYIESVISYGNRFKKD